MSYPQNDFRDYLEHSAKGKKWKNHKYIEIRNGRYIYPEDVSVKESSLRNRRNAMDMPIVSQKVSKTKSKLGTALGVLIGKPNGRIATGIGEKSSRREIEKRRKKLKDNEAKRKINARNAEADKNQREVQNVIDRMFKERNSKSIRKSSRR